MSQYKPTKEEKQACFVDTDEFRASHAHVFTATKMNEDDKPRYSIEMLFVKETTDLSVFQKAVKAACICKWGRNKEEWPTPLKFPYRDGDKPRKNKKTGKVEVRPEHVGMYVMRASTLEKYGRPHVVGRDPKVKLENEQDFYSGCYARAALKASAYEMGDNMGVSFILDGVQFSKHGEPFGGKRSATKMFGVIEGDSGDESFDDIVEEEI